MLRGKQLLLRLAKYDDRLQHTGFRKGKQHALRLIDDVIALVRNGERLKVARD
jgi:hypothetical protein